MNITSNTDEPTAAMVAAMVRRILLNKPDGSTWEDVMRLAYLDARALATPPAAAVTEGASLSASTPYDLPPGTKLNSYDRALARARAAAHPAAGAVHDLTDLRAQFEAWAADEWDGKTPPDAAWIGFKGHAALATTTALPASAKVVPVEPTPAMMKAAADAWLDSKGALTLNRAGAALRAGIAAAPDQGAP